MIYAIAKRIFFIYYKLFFKVVKKGQDFLPKDRGFILCSNHSSVQDPLVLAGNVKSKIHFIGKKEIFSNWFFSYILTALGIIPVDRSNPNMSVFKQAIQLLKEGKILGLFAQGKRMSQIEAGEAKAGVALFALKAEVCVVPVNIRSTYKFFSKIYLTFGEPIYLDEYKGQKVRTETLNEITEQIMNKVAELETKV